MPEQARWKFGSIVIQGSVRMSCTPGIAPDQGLMIQPTNDVQPTNAIDDLVLEWGDGLTWTEVRRWKDCCVTRLERQWEPYIDTMYTIQDRRWKWKFPFVHGSYNVRDETGKLIEGDSLKSMRGLATILLTAMNEEAIDVAVLDDDIEPYAMGRDLIPQIAWLYANAAIELEKLCQLVGGSVHLLADNTIAIRNDEDPTLLPELNQIDPTVAAYSFDQKPEKIRAFASDTLFDGWLALEPVAPELGGNDSEDSDVKRIHDLSFTPVGGWDSCDPEEFMAIGRNADGTPVTTGPLAVESYRELVRQHCKKYIWKMFRICGFAGDITKPPGYRTDLNPEDLVDDVPQPFPDVVTPHGYPGYYDADTDTYFTDLPAKQMKNILPLEPTRLQSGIDEFGKFRKLPAEVAGQFKRHDTYGTTNTPTGSLTIWNYGFRVDVKNGYVFMNRPCFRITPIEPYNNDVDQIRFRTLHTGTELSEFFLDTDKLYRTMRMSIDAQDAAFYEVAERAPGDPWPVVYMPPVLYLRCGHGLKKDFYGVRYHHAWTYTTGATNGTGIEPLRKTEFQRVVIESYDSDYTNLNVFGNTPFDTKPNVEGSLEAAVTEYAMKYELQIAPFTNRYSVPYSQDTNSSVKQITWEAGATQPFIQTVSVGTEHDYGQMTQEKKEWDAYRAKNVKDANEQFGVSKTLDNAVRQQWDFGMGIVSQG